jgi:N-acetylneuraminic acid mutarotase
LKKGLELPTIAGVQSKGWLYDPDTDSWTAVATEGAPSARMNHAAVCIGGKVVIFGGQSNKNVSSTPPATLLGDGGIYDPATDSWQLIAGQADVSGRSEAKVFGVRNKLIVAKGKCDLEAFPVKYCETFDVYDLNGKTWQVIKSADKELLASLQYGEQSVAESGGYIFLYGGYKMGGAYGEKAFLFPVVP